MGRLNARWAVQLTKPLSLLGLPLQGSRHNDKGMADTGWFLLSTCVWVCLLSIVGCLIWEVGSRNVSVFLPMCTCVG
jgi:hypothetical protein